MGTAGNEARRLDHLDPGASAGSPVFRKENQIVMATNNQKGTVAALAQQLIAGTAKHLTNGTQVTLEGSSLTSAQITSKLQQLVTLRSDVNAAKASTKAKLAVEAADGPALRTFVGAFVTYLKAAYGSAPDVLADFGVHPKARTPLTVEAKAAAAAKSRATRAARHTMGTTQKKAIKGAVTGITLTPILAPQPVAATPASPTAGATSPVVPAVPAPHAT